MKKVGLLAGLTLFLSQVGVEGAEASGDEANCRQYCQSSDEWPKAAMRYKPKDGRCPGGGPSVQVSGPLTSIFSLVMRNSKCEDRSNPAVPLPSDFKPTSKRGARVKGKPVTLFCFKGTGKFSQTKFVTYKRAPNSTWGSGVGCYELNGTKKAFPPKKAKPIPTPSESPSPSPSPEQ